MSKFVSLSSFLFALGLIASSQPSVAAELTARDLRMTANTRWDYQPMQGPRYATQDNSIFRPGTEADPMENVTPPSPVDPGDWRDTPPRMEDRVPPNQHPKDPRTVTALELGLHGSYYHYHESSLGVTFDGPQGGAQFLATGALGSQWFVGGEGRVTFGSLKYEGSGESDNNDNVTAEVRATIGRDFVTRNWGVSPYLGVGYRYLHSDSRGVTTTGAHGYQRDNHLLFMPIGVQPRMQLPSGDRISLTAEYAPVLHGWQESFLSDVNGYPDLTNKQRGGYGLRGDLMYQKENWSFGPFVNYWNINQSDTECGTGSLVSVCGYEPHNHTVEYGVQFRYRFYQD